MALIGATIGFVASVLGFLCKEMFDRRRQRRAAINTLRLMAGCLREGLLIEPEQIPHVHLDKMMAAITELATMDDLRKAFSRYDHALRVYRSAWKETRPPTLSEREEIRTQLDAVEEVVRSYGDGSVSNLLDWLAGPNPK